VFLFINQREVMIMATVKTHAGTRTGKKFIVLTMGPKEAGSVIANLKAGPSNTNTQNVVDALESTGLARSYVALAAEPAQTIPAQPARLVAA
jgi:hypothetical protein